MVSNKEDGEFRYGRNPYGIFTDVGSKFSLYANGRGRFEDQDLLWSYDANSHTFTVKRPNTLVWGWIDEIPSAAAERTGDTIVLNYTRLYSNGKPFPVELIIVPTRVASLVGAVVRLEPKTFDRDFFIEEYETSPGVLKRINLKRDFETSVTATDTIGAEAGAQAKLGSENISSISVGLKLKIEASLGTTIGTRDTFEEGYELDGKEHLKMTVRWVKRFRRGTITLANGEKRAFEVFIGYRTIPEYDK